MKWKSAVPLLMPDTKLGLVMVGDDGVVYECEFSHEEGDIAVFTEPRPIKFEESRRRRRNRHDCQRPRARSRAAGPSSAFTPPDERNHHPHHLRPLEPQADRRGLPLRLARPSVPPARLLAPSRQQALPRVRQAAKHANQEPTAEWVEQEEKAAESRLKKMVAYEQIGDFRCFQIGTTSWGDREP